VISPNFSNIRRLQLAISLADFLAVEMARATDFDKDRFP
jgi:hypothetical protein